MRDTMAEMAERAQLISQEAGSKVAAAMKDVISLAAGMAGFAVESARDLVQYMVRRGQMTQDEADKLIREAEESHGRKAGSERSRATTAKAERTAVKAEVATRQAAPRGEHAAPAAKAPAKPAAAKKPAAASAAAKPEKAAAPKSAAKKREPKAPAAKKKH